MSGDWSKADSRASEPVTAVHAWLDLLLTVIKYFRALQQKQVKG